ncbi:AP2-associated kinase [Fistulifera solaris]|uniref:non-specific serine/threonine protein kinase n=1 Tax=Fistulifera solaris TaxID=1519565 RepID=A0A1Z5J5T9_FISSO|nr:AP2-associated kinase [Fistulifera solaris]|eukprot:GAX09272.1 AP2-associated kinase [Fistulifera solaris]
MPGSEGSLGAGLVGEKISINSRQVAVMKLLGEGGFAYVYQVRELSDGVGGGNNMNNTGHDGRKSKHNKDDAIPRASETSGGKKDDLVLKVTSIISRQQRDIAEKEAKLLSRLSHPSIIKMVDACYRTPPTEKSGGFRSKDDGKKERPQHLILMEYCEGGHALNVCNNLMASGMRFDLSTLIIAFGQICNAVSYLHAQRPPIVHRDLKPANFLVKGGAYKLCDFGSAVFGHVKLDTPQARSEAEEVIQKTTTQMFRAPEMVDLFMAKKLTQATDVWALGCCLYSMAFLQDCFEEGSNLAILSRNFKIPEDNPYGDGLTELIDRMLTVDVKARADMTEVILCLSAVYSGRPLPPRKEPKAPKKEKEPKKTEKDTSRSPVSRQKKSDRVGSYRTDGQGVQTDGRKTKEGKALDPNSAAARRRRAAATTTNDTDLFEGFNAGSDNNAFAGDFAAFDGAPGSFDASGGEWDANDSAVAEAFASFNVDVGEGGRRGSGRTRSNSAARRPRRRDSEGKQNERSDPPLIDTEEEHVDESGVSTTIRRGVPRSRSGSAGSSIRRSRSQTKKTGKSKSKRDASEGEESD